MEKENRELGRSATFGISRGRLHGERDEGYEEAQEPIPNKDGLKESHFKL